MTIPAQETVYGIGTLVLIKSRYTNMCPPAARPFMRLYKDLVKLPTHGDIILDRRVRRHRIHEQRTPQRIPGRQEGNS